MEAVNTALFSLVNGSSRSPALLQFLAQFGADQAPFLALVVMAMYWLAARDKRVSTATICHAIMAAALGLGLNQLIGLAWFHPRPFMIGLGHQLIAHTAETSFPSDHATFVFSVAAALLTAPSGRSWGIACLLLGFLCAWARVFAGIHFPFDMIGSAGVAAIVLLPARSLSRIVIAWASGFLRSNSIGR